MRDAARPSAPGLFYNAPVNNRVIRAESRAHGFSNTLPSVSNEYGTPPKRHSEENQAAFPPANMNRLAKFLPLENVVVGLSVTSKKRVFEQAGLIFENQNGVARSTVTDNLFARERLGSTGLGAGVAIPHGRIKGLKHPLAAFVRLVEPIPFESPDGQPVSLLIFLLVPEQATQQHLEILSEIAQLLSDREARERLHTEEDRNVLYRLLTQWQP